MSGILLLKNKRGDIYIYIYIYKIVKHIIENQGYNDNIY